MNYNARGIDQMKRQMAKAAVEGGELFEVQRTGSDKQIPIQHQISLEMYEPKNQKRRSLVKRSEDVVKLVRDLWSVVIVDDKFVIEEAEYLIMMQKFHLVIVPRWSYIESDLLSIAKSDWNRDRGTENNLNFERFFASIWELVDTWCETADEQEYVAMLQRLIGATTTAGTSKEKTWKPDEEIEYDPFFSFDNQLSKTEETSSGDGTPNGVAMRNKRQKDKVCEKSKQRNNFRMPLASNSTSYLPTKKCCKLVSMIYSKKVLSDIFTEKTRFIQSNSKVNFDNFVIKLFLLQGGTRGIARRNLRAFTRSLEHHTNSGDTHPRLKVFQALAGLNASHYDAELLEKFAAPVLRSVSASTQLEKFLGDGSQPVLVEKKRFLKAAIPKDAFDIEEGIRVIDQCKR